MDSELSKLRSSADSLAQCLGALLKRIEDLEEQSSPAAGPRENGAAAAGAGDATAKMLRRIAAAIGGSADDYDPLAGERAAEVNRREFVTIDPISGAKKRTTVTERVIDAGTPVGGARTVEKSSPTGARSPRHSAAPEGGADLSPARDNIFRPRLVSIPRELMERIDVEFFAGEAIVVRIPPEAIPAVRPGDAVLEVGGQPAAHRRQFRAPHLGERVSLKLLPSDVFALPPNFYKILDDYRANESDPSASARVLVGTGGPYEDLRPSTSRQDHEKQHQQNGFSSAGTVATVTVANTGLLPYLSFDLKKGDILQMISVDKMCMQARKVNDLSASGFVPLNIRTERVGLLAPYGRRVVALLGANGVGRRTLKRMLLQKLPAHFTSDVPLTSRAPKPGEVNGRDFHFVIKEHFHDLIRANQMIEWGESNGHLYGTSAENVRQIIRSGRVCVLDCTERALKLLYVREFAPYVVVIAAPPSRDELARLAAQRAAAEGRPPPTDEMLRRTWEENGRLMDSPYAKHFNLVLVNRNFDVTLRRLIDALEHLRKESQWIPLDWMS